MKLRGLFVAAAMLLMPAAALAAPGIVTTVSLKAGPGEGFPTVDRIPGGAHVDVHGCFRGKAWCDVSWSDDRGWVSSRMSNISTATATSICPTMSTRSTFPSCRSC